MDADDKVFRLARIIIRLLPSIGLQGNTLRLGEPQSTSWEQKWDGYSWKQNSDNALGHAHELEWYGPPWPLRAGRHRYHSLSSQREKYSQVAGDMRPPGMHSPATGHSPHGMLVRAKEVG